MLYTGWSLKNSPFKWSFDTPSKIKLFCLQDSLLENISATNLSSWRKTEVKRWIGKSQCITFAMLRMVYHCWNLIIRKIWHLRLFSDIIFVCSSPWQWSSSAYRGFKSSSGVKCALPCRYTNKVAIVRTLLNWTIRYYLQTTRCQHWQTAIIH